MVWNDQIKVSFELWFRSRYSGHFTIHGCVQTNIVVYRKVNSMVQGHKIYVTTVITTGFTFLSLAKLRQRYWIVYSNTTSFRLECAAWNCYIFKFDSWAMRFSILAVVVFAAMLASNNVEAASSVGLISLRMSSNIHIGVSKAVSLSSHVLLVNLLVNVSFERMWRC